MLAVNKDKIRSDKIHLYCTPNIYNYIHKYIIYKPINKHIFIIFWYTSMFKTLSEIRSNVELSLLTKHTSKV